MQNELLTSKICEHLSAQIMSGKLDNDDLVQIIAHVGNYLNLETVSTYSRQHGMSYNGVKKFRNVINLFGAKFVIDNL